MIERKEEEKENTRVGGKTVNPVSTRVITRLPHTPPQSGLRRTRAPRIVYHRDRHIYGLRIEARYAAHTYVAGLSHAHGPWARVPHHALHRVRVHELRAHVQLVHLHHGRHLAHPRHLLAVAADEGVRVVHVVGRLLRELRRAGVRHGR